MTRTEMGNNQCDKLTLMRAATVPSLSTGLILAVRFVPVFITEVTIA